MDGVFVKLKRSAEIDHTEGDQFSYFFVDGKRRRY